MAVDGAWALLTASFVLVLYIAQGGVVLSSVIHLSHVAGAEWRADIGPYTHQTVRLYPLAFVLLVLLLVMRDATFPYYADAGDVHLNAWHNYPFLVSRELGMFLLVAAVSYGYVRASARDHHENTPASRKSLTRYAALMPFLYFVYGTLVAWDFEMTLQPGWHSPMYAPYFFVSNFHMFLGLFVLVLYLSGLGRRGLVATQSFNYLAQMMLGLTLLWTYTFFAQFITIWYGNLPHETSRLYALMYADADIRREASAIAPFFWWFLALKAFVPFGLLIFAVVRHTPGLIALVGAIILAGTFLERYTWIGGAYPTWHAPFSHAADIALVALLAAYVFVTLHRAFTGKPRRLWFARFRGSRR